MKESWEAARLHGESDYTAQFSELIARIDLSAELIDPAQAAICWYTNRLPYHNIEHMFAVTEEVLDQCGIQKLDSVARQALCLAALWHDADYPTPLSETPEYVSKEQRSAKLAFDAITQTTDPSQTCPVQTTQLARQVADLIESTHESKTPSTPYEIILNQADLCNLQGSLVEVLQNTMLLFVESRILAGEEFVGNVEQFAIDHAEQLTDYCNSSQIFLQKLLETKFTRHATLASLRETVLQISPKNIRRLVFGKPS